MPPNTAKKNLFERKGAPVLFHREIRNRLCLCVTPEGFRDPLFHKNWRDNLIVQGYNSGFGGTVYAPGAYQLVEYWFFINAGDDNIPIPVGIAAAYVNSSPSGTFSFLLSPQAQLSSGAGFIVFRRLTDSLGVPGPIKNLGSFHVNSQNIWVDDVLLTAGINVPTADIPTCTQLGYVPQPVEIHLKAFVQPQWGARRTRQYLLEQFGEIRSDDHIGMFPLTWKGVPIDFENWSDAGDEYVEFLTQRFTVVAWTLIPDPRNSGAYHHWEVVLRRINTDTPLV